MANPRDQALAARLARHERDCRWLDDGAGARCFCGYPQQQARILTALSSVREEAQREIEHVTEERDLLQQWLTEKDVQPSTANLLNAAGRRQFDLRVQAEAERDALQQRVTTLEGMILAICDQYESDDREPFTLDTKSLRAAVSPRGDI